MVIRSFADVVTDYTARFQQRHRRELRWFAIQRSLEDAIELAAMAVSPAGKRLSHQRRIPKATLRAWADCLLRRSAQIRESKTFAALHTLMSEAGADLHGIGDLAVYDTATRVGAFLRIDAECVYLHAGTREGARALGFNANNSLSRTELPEPFCRLSADEIEDCLCIYKREIEVIASGATEHSRTPRGCFGRNNAAKPRD